MEDNIKMSENCLILNDKKIFFESKHDCEKVYKLLIHKNAMSCNYEQLKAYLAKNK